MIIRIEQPGRVEYVEVEQLITTEKGGYYLINSNRYEIKQGSVVSIIASVEPHVVERFE